MDHVIQRTILGAPARIASAEVGIKAFLFPITRPRHLLTPNIRPILVYLHSLPDSATPSENIPDWAFIDTSTQFWSYDASKALVVNQTSSTSASSEPSSTSSRTSMTDTLSATPTLTPTETPTTSPVAAPISSGHKSVNAGAIGGGVGGGVGALLVIILLLIFLRRRRARRSNGGGVMGAGGEDGSRNPSSSSESSLTESGKAPGAVSHYTPHSQMAQLHHQGGSGVLVGSYSTTSGLSTSALHTPVDAPPMPVIPREYASPTPARSLAASPTPSVPAAPVTNKVKRVPVRYSEDELARAEEAEIQARKASVSGGTGTEQP
ncbi:hypothetical protein FRC12_003523 [Ceratobasidium sp. 428]|nr:hypothetical protein FRC12_003523 [Ceratobasidium sp. 428]